MDAEIELGRRDLFACFALQGLLRNCTSSDVVRFARTDGDKVASVMADAAYGLADAMLAARTKPREGGAE